MKHKYAIIVHDPAIIIAAERERRYSMLDDYSYLLVGKHSTFLERTYTCCHLEHNIEDYGNLLHYTAMYAVVMNELFKDYDRITFLEHDAKILSVDLGDKLAECKHTVYFEEEPIGTMFGGPYANEVKQYIQRTYGDLYMMFKSYTKVMRCINISFPMPTLQAFIRCPHTKAFIQHISKSARAGHALERWMSYWLWTNDNKAQCLPNLVKNTHNNSHKQ